MKGLVAMLVLGGGASAQQPVWVFFEDKGAGRELAAELAVLEESYGTRAVERRRLRRTAPGLFDERDLPVAEEYLQQVLATGAELRTASSWLNAISVVADAEQRVQIEAFDFVDHTRPVRALTTAASLSAGASAAGGSFYGVATTQLDQIRLSDLHAAGFTGDGVIVGILDTGFRQTHDAFTFPGHPLDVVAEWDFVDNDPVTGPEPGDAGNQHDHGTWILGTIAAYEPNTIVGGAYDCSVILAKCEDVAPDLPVEEDWFVAGLQFIEANGGDVATSSLIAGNDLYGPDEDDGLTSVMTLGFNVAAENGVHCFQGAGNSGHDTNPATDTLQLPADAFQVLTCGAVNAGGAIAGFSSDGPTVDGRIKPEILARGVNVRTVDSDDPNATDAVSGTSLSTPLCAAAAACLVQAHPTWTVNQMRRALTHTAQGYVANGTYDPLFIEGYGIIDAEAARHQLDPGVYCSHKTIAAGCPPWIDYAGTPSASSSQSFDVFAGELANDKFGLFFYGTSGAQVAPFMGGKLCVAAPFVRTPVQSTGGSVGTEDCTGKMSLDFNAWIQSGVDPNLVVGAQVNAQYWFRDPLASFGVGLTDGIAFTVGP